MYNTKYVCTYAIDVFLKEDNISQHDKDFILNCLYRNDFLYIFGLEDFDNDFSNKIIEDLYEKIRKNDFLLSCVKKITEDYICLDNYYFGLLILYSFDFLHLTHPCVSDYLETGRIEEENMLLLKEKVFRENNMMD